MGNGNNDVGDLTRPRDLDQPVGAAVQDPARAGAAQQPRICGAMSQQRGDSGYESAPQKLVQLVGCRDPKAHHPKEKPTEKLKDKPKGAAEQRVQPQATPTE